MAASSDTVCNGLIKLLHLLYEKDILGEDAIMKWYNSGDDESSTAAALRKQVITTVHSIGSPKSLAPKAESVRLEVFIAVQIQVEVFWVVTMKMEAAGSSKMLVPTTT
jgi:hypothetical protein